MKRLLFIPLILCVAFGCVMTSCSKEDDDSSSNNNSDDSSSNDNSDDNSSDSDEEDLAFKDVATFPFGGAVSPTRMVNYAYYTKTIMDEMNSITPENAMKMLYLSTGNGTYDWEDADYLVDFAIDKDIRIHGHTLVWNNSIPAWMSALTSTDEEFWKNILKTYITDVLTHFKGKVLSWDVVNEAIGDDGLIKDGFWKTKLGDDYVALAFTYAHEADPDLLLFYNDYGHEYSSTRRNGINTMIADLIAAGVPIHGIGLQMHTNIARTMGDLETAIEVAAETGLLVHVSELDIQVNKDGATEFDFNILVKAQQREKYAEVSEAMSKLPLSQQFGITTWGVNDSSSWLSTDSYPEYPLVFDDNYERKEAYYGLMDGVE